MRNALTLQRPLDRILGVCCAALLAGLVGLTVVDVIGRYWFNAPVAGAFWEPLPRRCARNSPNRPAQP